MMTAIMPELDSCTCLEHGALKMGDKAQLQERHVFMLKLKEKNLRHVQSQGIGKIRRLHEQASLEISPDKTDLIKKIFVTFLDPNSLFSDEFIALIESEEEETNVV